MKQMWLWLIVLALMAVPAAQAENLPDEGDFAAAAPPMLDAPPPVDVKWTAEELLAGMTLRQKVGQLFVVRPQRLNINSAGERISGGTTSVTEEMRATYERLPVGGFILFSDNIVSPIQLRQYIGDLRALCAVAPIIAVDEEGGSVSRLANKSAFGLKNVGSMASIGKTGDVQNAYDAGASIGAYLADYGFTLDFAPVADVRSNPQNSVIGNRSFSSDPQTVSQMVSACIDGLHSQGIRACIKHFPGHGDTKGDTHKGFVELDKTGDELMATELVPFIGNLQRTDMVMAAHISLTKIAGDEPASLSRRIITDGLRGGLGYQGLVITDSLEMGAITDLYKSDEAAVKAFEAGVDLLLMPSSLTRAFEGMVAAVESGRIPMSRLDESVLRILRMKLGE